MLFQPFPRYAALLALCLLGVTLSGCSTTRLVDTQVTAFPQWNGAPPVPPTPYRFERLPSQQASSGQQEQMEAHARTALAKVGLELQPVVARYSVQVQLATQVLELDPYEGGRYDGFGFGAPGVFLGGGSRGTSLGLSFPLGGGGWSRPYYKRDLSLLIRDLRTQQVVYEVRAMHEGVWSDGMQVVPAMLEAALRGFPQPPTGTRRIDIDIAR